MFRRTAFALLLSATTFAFAAHAGITAKDQTYSIAGKALGLKFTGSGKFSVAERDGKIVFTSFLNTVDMGLRQKHTKEHFQVLGDTRAQLVIDKSKLTLPEKGSHSGTVQGTVKLIGGMKKNDKGEQEQVKYKKDGMPVPVSYTVKKEGNHYVIEKAEFTFSYTSFINEICEMKVCVKPEVTISVSDAKVEG